MKWSDHHNFVSSFRKTKIGDPLYKKCLAAGVNQKQFDNFINSGGNRKRHPSFQSDTTNQVDILLDMGGHIAGGAALRELMFVSHPGDVDVFFNDRLQWIRATLLVHDNPEIDVCLYDKIPYEGFDITASQCSRSKSGWNLHPNFVEAHKTKLSHIIKSNIIQPIATLNRMIKYNERYDIKFTLSDSIWLCANFAVSDDNLVNKVMEISL